jgi:endonuclease/exonuclease/phosphatase family metal-dependent hydrolase
LKAREQLVDVTGSFVVAAEVDHPDRSVVVASIHVCPDRRLAKNVGTLGTALPAVVAGRPFVVGGDLNSSRHFDAVYKRRTHAAFLAKMSAIGAHDCLFTLHGRETQSYWGRAREAYQVDHLFVDAGAASRVRACDVLTTDATRKLSDHSPVVLDLE